MMKYNDDHYISLFKNYWFLFLYEWNPVFPGGQVWRDVLCEAGFKPAFMNTAKWKER